MQKVFSTGGIFSMRHFYQIPLEPFGCIVCPDMTLVVKMDRSNYV